MNNANPTLLGRAGIPKLNFSAIPGFTGINTGVGAAVGGQFVGGPFVGGSNTAALLDPPTLHYDTADNINGRKLEQLRTNKAPLILRRAIANCLHEGPKPARAGTEPDNEPKREARPTLN